MSISHKNGSILLFRSGVNTDYSRAPAAAPTPTTAPAKEAQQQVEGIETMRSGMKGVLFGIISALIR